MVADTIHISIQIPTYRQERYIRETVDSVLFQEYPYLEVVVSDDCSPDYDVVSCLDAQMELHPGRLQVYRNTHNLGRVANYRHTLYERVRGDYFMNLDGDDRYFHTQFLAEAARLIGQYRRGQVVSFEFGHDLSLVRRYVRQFEEIDEQTIVVNGRDYIQMLQHHRQFLHANCLFHVDTARRVGFYEQDVLATDFYSAIKLWTQGYVMLSSKKIFSWNMNAGSSTHTDSMQNVEREQVAIADFKRFAQAYFSPCQLRTIVLHLYYALYRHVYFMYRVKGSRDCAFYSYAVTQFRLNKYYIKFLVDQLKGTL